MVQIRFHRVRAEVRELWSGEPVKEAALVQAAAEQANNMEEPGYPPVRAVAPEEGIWELFLPCDLVYELRRQSISELELSAKDRYFCFRFPNIACT